MKLHSILFVSALVVAALWQSAAPQSAQAAPPVTPGRVLILDTTVSGGATSHEATIAAGLGLLVDIVTPAEWSAITAATGVAAPGCTGGACLGFGDYRALILGDPTCVTGTGSVAAAEANASVWGAAANGNVVIIGTDPTFHSTFGPGGAQGGDEVTAKGIAFATADTGKTGAYITLSCYYEFAGPLTPVPLLAGLSSAPSVPVDPPPPSGFTVSDAGSCFDNAHIVATHPALTSPPALTDANLSNWGCSVHEVFDSWPNNFQVLAIALTGTAFTAADGTVGTPYILARSPALVPVGAGGPANTVPTSGVISASGTGPVIECTWELPDMDSYTPGIQYTRPAPGHLHDDDLGIVPDRDNNPANGTQFPCHGPGDTPPTKPTMPQGVRHMIQVAPNFENLPEERQIQNWVAVDDPGTVSDVFWIVWEPCTPVTNPLCVLTPDGGLAKKLQVHGTRLGAAQPQPCTSLFGTSTTDGAMTEAAIDSDQVTKDSFDDLNKGMIALCNQNVKGLYSAEWPLSKDQPCGEYRIDATAVSVSGATTTLTNYIDIICTTQLKIDFGGDPSVPCAGGITWPALSPGFTSTVGGDLIFAPGCDTRPTVKNVGNSGMGLRLSYSDLVGATFGKHIYEFDACYGRVPDATLKCFPSIVNQPAQATPTSPVIPTEVDFGTLPAQVLCANELGKLDPSVHPQPGLPADTYTGTATLVGYAVPGECYGNKHGGGNSAGG